MNIPQIQTLLFIQHRLKIRMQTNTNKYKIYIHLIQIKTQEFELTITRTPLILRLHLLCQSRPLQALNTSQDQSKLKLIMKRLPQVYLIK